MKKEGNMTQGYEESSLDVRAKVRFEMIHTALDHVRQILSATNSKEELIGKVCEIMVSDAGYLMSWIGWLNPKTHIVVPAAFAGAPAEEYLGSVRVTADGSEKGQGPTGRALREGGRFVCNDFLSDTRTEPWHVAARKAGIRASAAFPFRCGRTDACGTLNLYSRDLNAFEDTDTSLLEQITADVSNRLGEIFGAEKDGSQAVGTGDLEQMFRDFAELADEVFWIMRTQPELILFVNPAFEKVWGRPVSELYRNSRLWIDSIHLDDRPRIIELFSNWIQRIPGSTYNVEYRIVRPDGKLRWIHDRGVALVEAGEGTVTMAGIAEDITDRKVTEEDLVQSRERYKSVLDSMLEGCMVIGFDWTYIYVNETAARHGYQERENLLGRRMTSVYPGVEKSEVFIHYKHCMEERVPQRFESSYTFEDGTTNWYEFRVTPVPEGIFVLSLDITDRIKPRRRTEKG